MRAPLLPLALVPALGLVGCDDTQFGVGHGGAGDGGDAFGECGDPAGVHTILMTTLSFTRTDTTGAIHGFDLDEVVSDAGDPEGCGHADRTSPDGTSGIDSAFSALVPVLESIGASAVEGLIQAAIDSGELLILVEVDHLDDWSTDECLGVTMHRGRGTPIIGTDGAILVDQTFGLDTDVPSTAARDAWLDAGTVEVRDIRITLPVQLLDVFVTFEVEGGAMRFDLAEDGTVAGYFAGGVPVEQINSQISAIGDIGDLADIVPTLISSAADLFPDASGACTALSVGFDFTGKPAFLLE